MTGQKYDLIGDIHGHANDLKDLLRHMGYTDARGYFAHPMRKVIFLGDFVDRGVNQKQVLDIVMPMVTSGAALAIMGNHEFNALAFHTPHPEFPSSWLRERNHKNITQHRAFLKDYAAPKMADELQKVLDFFWSLPIWLELDGLRVIHACWDEKQINVMRRLTSDQRLNHELLVEASTRGAPAYDAIETLLKGYEVELPEGMTWKDKDGHARGTVRVQWWNRDARCFGDVAMPRAIKLESVAELPLPDDIPRYGADERPCFVGHYWLRGEPAPLAPNVACLDYSVARDGKLVAYRWDGEQTLTKDHYCFVGN